jgi:hypothetical protein
MTDYMLRTNTEELMDDALIAAGVARRPRRSVSTNRRRIRN